MATTKITTKILILLTFVLIVVPSVVLFRHYQSSRQYIDNQMAQTLSLALRFDLAIRHYVTKTLRPIMAEVFDSDRFIPETMSTSFVAHSVFEEVSKDFPSMLIKFSSQNPRNSKNMASPGESEVLAFFRDNPQATTWSGEITINQQRYIALFSPRWAKKECLECHSDPSVAPAALIARYGKESGFGYQEGDLIGTDTVALSYQAAQAELGALFEDTIFFGIALVSGFLGIFVGLKMLVLNRINAISRHFSTVIGQQQGATLMEIPVSGHDEIDEMVRSFNGMVRRLGDYSSALQREVEARRRINELLNVEVGERRKAEDSLHELFSQQEEIIQTRTEEIARQHTRLQEAHDELKQAQSQLLQREKMASIGQLAAGVAHEINNPVGFIQSNLSTLAKYLERFSEYMADQQAACAALPEEIRHGLLEKAKKLKIDRISADAKELVGECLEGTDRVREIVINLKNFSRVDHPEEQLANLNNCLDETLRIVWNELKYMATVTKDYGELPETLCHPQQLNQVFVNILVNAGQALVDKGEITIRTWEEAGVIFVAISDTGPGIPEEIRNRLFEPFFTTKEVGKGTGLGLSISYDIIKKHRGEIEITSEVGRGTTFTIQIPVRTPDNRQ